MEVLRRSSVFAAEIMDAFDRSPTDELELIRPSLYRNVARQLNVSPHSETAVTSAFLAVAAQIFSAGVTWGKVVSLYSVAAGLAVDCVRQAQPAVVPALVDCLGEFVHKTLASWLRRRGGWVHSWNGHCLKTLVPGLLRVPGTSLPVPLAPGPWPCFSAGSAPALVPPLSPWVKLFVPSPSSRHTRSLIPLWLLRPRVVRK